MENIIKQIREILDKPLKKEGLFFDERNNTYVAVLDKVKKISYCYYFDIRKKIGGDYFLLTISLRLMHKEISDIASVVKVEVINRRQGIPKSLKTSLLKDIKGNQVVTGLYDWRELNIAFANEINIWSCSIYDLAELEDYDRQLLFLFVSGQQWVKQCNDWDFLIDWALKHNDALQALSILKYLKRKEEFEDAKTAALETYKLKKYPIDELNYISM